MEHIYASPILWWFRINSSPLDKMATILADDIFECISGTKIPIHNSLKLVSNCPIDNKLALVQEMAWYRGGDELKVPSIKFDHTQVLCGIKASWNYSTWHSTMQYNMLMA